MTIRITTGLTLIVFVLFECSCTVHTVRTKHPEQISETRDEGLEVLRVFTKGGETVEFRTEAPGRINGEMVEGYAAYPETVTIAKAQVVKIERDKGGRLQTIWTKSHVEGHAGYTVESVISGTADSLSLAVISRETARIPLSAVDVLQIRTVDAPRTFMAVVGGSALVVGLGLVIAAMIVGYPFAPDFGN